jgi:hypothetical protein
MSRHLTQIKFEAEIARRRGLIPISLQTGDCQVVWADLDEYHCYEGFFHESLAVYAGLRGRQVETFTSGLDSLFSPPAARGCLSPTGFIFHAGRCGSTLLAKSLARSRQNLIFGEAQPHNQIWKVKSEGGGPGVDLYRSLAIAMGRKRRESYRSHIIKFTSFNIVQFAFIRAAFPGVPALFLFREPGALMDSYYRAQPRWMGKDLGEGMQWLSTEAAVESFFRAALSVRDSDFRSLDYVDLTPQSLPAILRHFHIEATDEEFRLMSAEFAWDAKSGPAPKRFVRGSGTVSCAPPRMASLYQDLKSHSPLLETRPRLRS